MHELASVKDEKNIIYYVIYHNKKYNELFVIPKYLNNKKIKDVNEIVKILDFQIIKESKYLKRKAMILPLHKIKVYYNPIARLKKLIKEPRDETELRVKELVELLVEESGEELSNFGIGGSILIGLHGKNSDIDLAYYGEKNEKIYSALLKLREEKVLRPLDEEELIKLYKERKLEKIIEFNLFKNIEKRKIIEGKFKDKVYSIKPILRKDFEPYRVLGIRKYEFAIKDDSLSYTFPSIYKAERINKGDIYEIISYKLRYSEMLKKGERAYVKGMLEEDKTGRLRLILQSDEDYIKPIEVKA